MSTERITIVRGDTWVAEYQFKRGGSPISLAGGHVTFTVKSNAQDDDADALFQLTPGDGVEITDAAAGKVRFTVASALTTAVTEPTGYVFDVQVMESSGRVSTPVLGTFAVVLDVTHTASLSLLTLMVAGQLLMPGIIAAGTGSTDDGVADAAVAISAPAITASATATVDVEAEASATAPSVTASCAAGMVATTAGALTSPSATAAGAATMESDERTITAALTLSPVTAAGDVEVNLAAAASATTSAVTAAATVDVIVDAASSLTTGAVSATGTGSVLSGVAAALAAPACTASGDADVLLAAVAAASAPAVALSAAGEMESSGPSIVDIGVTPVLYLDADAITGLSDGADMTEAAMNAAQLQDTAHTFAAAGNWPSYQATAYGGKPCIRLDSSNTESFETTAAALLALASGADTAVTLVAQVQFVTTGAMALAAWDLGATLNRQAFFLNSTLWSINRRSATNKTQSASNVSPTSAIVVSCLLDNATSQTADIREDGTLLNGSPLDVNTEALSGLTHFRIGARDIASGTKDLWANVRIRRYALYASKLTSTQEGNLRSGWAALDA